MTTPAEASVTASDPAPPKSAQPESPGRRLSTAVYAFEHTLVVSILLMMVVTYILTVLWNNANLQYDQLDQLIFKIAGYATPEDAPEAARATLAGVVAPIVLLVVMLALSYLAVRTREQSSARLAAEGQAPRAAFGPLSAALAKIASPGLRRLVWALLLTGAMWGFVQLVSVLPSGVLCVIALLAVVAFLVPTAARSGMMDEHGVVVAGLRAQLRTRGLLGVAGGVALGVVLAVVLGAEGAGALALVGLGLAAAGLVALLARQQDLVVGALTGLALGPAYAGFEGGNIPGFVGLALGLALVVSFLGPSLAGVFGGLLGGALLLAYFIGKAGPQYDWTSGLTAILLLYVGFLGASMATHDGRHITVDAVRKLFKSHNFHLYNAIGDIVTLLFTTFLGAMAVRYLIHMKVGGDQHLPSDLSAWIAVIPIGFGFTMMVVRFGVRIAAALGAWRRREPAPELAPELH